MVWSNKEGGGKMTTKKLFIVFLLTSLVLISSGCVKLGTYTHERVDLGTQGNRGYIVGSPPMTGSALEREDRKIMQLEITLPSAKEGEVSSSKSTDTKMEREISEPVYQPQIQPRQKKSSPKIK